MKSLLSLFYQSVFLFIFSALGHKSLSAAPVQQIPLNHSVNVHVLNDLPPVEIEGSWYLDILETWKLNPKNDFISFSTRYLAQKNRESFRGNKHYIQNISPNPLNKNEMLYYSVQSHLNFLNFLPRGPQNFLFKSIEILEAAASSSTDDEEATLAVKPSVYLNPHKNPYHHYVLTTVNYPEQIRDLREYAMNELEIPLSNSEINRILLDALTSTQQKYFVNPFDEE